MYDVIESGQHRHLPQSQRTRLLSNALRSRWTQTMPIQWNRWSWKVQVRSTNALLYLGPPTLRALHKFLDASQLISLKVRELVDWLDVTNCNVKESPLLMLFWEIAKSFKHVLGLRGPRELKMQVTKPRQWGHKNRWTFSKTGHRMGNVPSRVRSFLLDHVRFQQCVLTVRDCSPFRSRVKILGKRPDLIQFHLFWLVQLIL